MEKNLLFYVILAILVVQYLAHQYLEYLNAKRFKSTLPQELADIYDENEYRKSQQYKRTNYKFGLISDGFSLVLTVCFLSFGGFEWVDQLTRSITDEPIPMALIFFGIIMLGSSILGLPFSYYRTFVIEEQYGFNKTTKSIFLSDKLKGGILTIILGGGILTLFMLFYQSTGPNFWIYAWAMVAVVILFINLFYSRLIVPLFNKQTPLQEGSLKSSIENYAQKVGFELQNIFVIDGSKRSTKANAYFSGFGKEKRITLFDTLINDLSEDEIVAVLAHEVGHYKRKHIIVNLIVSLLTTGLTLFILSLFINHPEISLAIGVSTPSFHAALVGFALLYSPISEITGLVMNYLSRKFEFQADDFAKTTFAATPLVSSLKKLSKKSLSNLTPHPAYVFVHYSHPPLVERIRNLKA
ncbi:Ste24 endopeptidase [Allomuricauda ruestringensis DSM 13258]|uniref:Ste24 endopeptidase n=1 Tax=Allomuricauda ruestringensis (strain DSM 13258 / CIP 107369 / LMG 19739 / B1) TaxID=886377 RepID=G2PS76_ALLRU|nr:M48 family metallopeptidase [Allomuricauda ruestringensis]AEM69333.1 Ste24 endopeptidase [Allomuricauda ruestringensis DSM 13258]